MMTRVTRLVQIGGIALPLKTLLIAVALYAMYSGGIIRIESPWIGAEVIPVNDTIRSQFGLDKPGGLLVNRVYESSPAGEAGLRRGDIVLNIDQTPLYGTEDIRTLLLSKARYETVSAIFLRDGIVYSTNLTLDFHATILQWTLWIWAGSFLAGMLGALTGLGGGVVIVPMLALFFGIDIHYAMGASLVSIIATSSGAAAAYVREGFTNIRIGMFMEMATTVGAIVGAFLIAIVPTHAIAVIFGLVLLYSAFFVSQPPKLRPLDEVPDKLAAALRMDGHFPDGGRDCSYHVHRVPEGFAVMFGAGILAGLLGIGAGAAKVLALDQIMRIPFKVSITTSNFMIGVTAAACAGIYLSRGYIEPGLAMPVMLGVVLGSVVGAKVLVHAPARALRLLFGIVLLVLACEMIFSGFTGRI
jgi:hypothetical protein